MVPALALSPVTTSAGIMAAFAVKHYVADFLLQTGWMARGKDRPGGWLGPLLGPHRLPCGAHARLALALAPHLWWLALVDAALHFGIDRSKSLLARSGGWQPAQCQFWWVLGFDQLLHQLTNIGIATALLLL
jgi:hypothetical protein